MEMFTYASPAPSHIRRRRLDKSRCSIKRHRMASSIERESSDVERDDGLRPTEGDRSPQGPASHLPEEPRTDAVRRLRVASDDRRLSGTVCRQTMELLVCPDGAQPSSGPARRKSRAGIRVRLVVSLAGSQRRQRLQFRFKLEMQLRTDTD